MANTTYLRYHSALKIQYVTGELDHNTQRRIPRSTRQRWKQLSVHSFWMPGMIPTPQRKQIRKMRFLLYLLKRQQCILRSFPVKHHHILPANDYLKHVDKRLNHDNRKRFWQYLPFSYKQWTAWNSRKICAASLVQLCLAQVDIIQSNSIAEAANKILKYRYLFPYPVADTEELVKVLDNALADYNHIPQKNLYGLTPHEVLNGNIPDKQKFKMQIANARKRRVAVNQHIACTDDCSP